MLADDAASRAAWLGEDGALAAMPSGSIAVECSTLSPDWIRELHEAVTHRGLRMAEAPVTGSRTQAEAGQLNFLVGADEDTLAAITPVLQCMSKEILHLGPVGSGAQLKLINNFLCAVQVTSFAEALVWMERTGLRLDTALDFLKRGAPGSGILSAMSERMTHRTYEVNFLLRLMAKDLRYARAAAAQLGIDVSCPLPRRTSSARPKTVGWRKRHVGRCGSGSPSGSVAVPFVETSTRFVLSTCAHLAQVDRVALVRDQTQRHESVNWPVALGAKLQRIERRRLCPLKPDFIVLRRQSGCAWPFAIRR